jgi:hypothetical protein
VLSVTRAFALGERGATEREFQGRRRDPPPRASDRIARLPTPSASQLGSTTNVERTRATLATRPFRTGQTYH